MPSNQSRLIWRSKPEQPDARVHLAADGHHRALCGEDVLFHLSEASCPAGRECFRCQLIALRQGDTLPPMAAATARDTTTRSLL